VKKQLCYGVEAHEWLPVMGCAGVRHGAAAAKRRSCPRREARRADDGMCAEAAATRTIDAATTGTVRSPHVRFTLGQSAHADIQLCIAWWRHDGTVEACVAKATDGRTCCG
jgi:hypothetical protein